MSRAMEFENPMFEDDYVDDVADDVADDVDDETTPAGDETWEVPNGLTVASHQASLKKN